MRALFQPTILFALALMAVIVMMVVPIPSWLLDIGLAASFSLAILMFTTALFVERPLDFSSFPTVLLASLMLRLALNVSSTKLIIGEGHTGTGAAGSVIEGFAQFVMGGNLFLGFVIFCVLLIVNFVVITKGATRMAEVGARFALDGMPGKQMAIDSDVSAGAISHEEARSRRELEQAETTFFGSLDGASKFVKGDAVAGLLITLLNLIVGLTVGLAVHGMAPAEAMRTFAVLTVGDGLVSQIPAVVISIASALLLARGGASGKMDAAILAQIGGNPLALGTVAVIMAVFAAIPGLPVLPFLLGASVLGFVGWRRHKAQTALASEIPVVEDMAPPKKTIGDVLDLDEISVTFAMDLVSLAMDPARGLESRIEGMRNHIAQSYGVILPEIRLTDDAGLPPGTYVIRIHGVEMARDRLFPGHLLVLRGDAPLPAVPGTDVAEPVYGAPARWIDERAADPAGFADLTAVTPGEVLATHLMEVVKSAFPQLIGLKSLNRLLDAWRSVSDPDRAAENRRLIDDLVPSKVPYDVLLTVLRLLLSERVSIRNLPVILESAAEGRDAKLPTDVIAEITRQRLSQQILADLRRPDGTVPMIQLSPAWEEHFERHQMQGGSTEIALPPDAGRKLRQGIAEAMAKAAENGSYPALVTSARRRRYLHTVMRDAGLTNPVISYEEVGPSARPALVGSVAA
ncbi:flagellar biosynthesis protein FlhA [Jannaschia aquimarina]|uniref:FlhA_2 protein n=1 Tax=Jannaschia aquimarina TaxID=935700 RepID=A0A0D1EBP4_9RHOB|nr:flagellar biosynthesis protein FlhA [Jannaschia aquimarina]KIT14291.1 Flagellar biosynthesis protein FlhA [Jannaschia aquimarina]SNS50159.1 flagellar biosynthesis protein FlhA [Jannaschia aquimarina]